MEGIRSTDGTVWSICGEVRSTDGVVRSTDGAIRRTDGAIRNSDVAVRSWNGAVTNWYGAVRSCSVTVKCCNAVQMAIKCIRRCVALLSLGRAITQYAVARIIEAPKCTDSTWHLIPRPATPHPYLRGARASLCRVQAFYGGATLIAPPENCRVHVLVGAGWNTCLVARLWGAVGSDDESRGSRLTMRAFSFVVMGS